MPDPDAVERGLFAPAELEALAEVPGGAAALRFMQLMNRGMAAMVECGQRGASPAVLAELQAIEAGYRTLLTEETGDLVSRDQLAERLADTLSWVARAHDGLGHASEAAEAFRVAEEEFRRLGNTAAAAECREAAARALEFPAGDIDSALLRVHRRLDGLEPGSLEHAEALVEIAELHGRAGDDFESTDLMRRAETELEALGYADITPDDLMSVVSSSIAEIEAGTAVPGTTAAERAERARGLLTRVCHGLSYSLREIDPTAASGYLERLQLPDRRDPERIAVAGELAHLAAELDAPTMPLDALLIRADLALREARRTGVKDLEVVAAMRRAELLMRLDRAPDAAAVLVEARALLAGARRHDLEPRLLGTLASCHARDGDWAAASATCGAGIALVEEHRARVSGEYMRDAYLGPRIELYALGVRAAHELRDHALMLERAELSKSRSLLRHHGHDAQRDDEAAAVEFERVCRRIDEARARGEPVDELMRRRRILWDLRLIARGRGRQLGEPFSVEALQASLADDEAVLYHYWVDRDTLLVATLDKHDVTHELRRLGAEDRQELDAFAHAVLDASVRRAARFAALERLAPALLPSTGTRFEGKRRLFVSPHRVLHVVPFHSLPWNGKPLLEHVAVTYVPNLASLLLPPAPAVAPSVLAIGIGEYRHADLTWRPLRHAVAEAADVARLYAGAGRPATSVLQDDAEEERLGEINRRGELGRAACVHLATHGTSVNADTPMESYLCAVGSRLDGLELAGWRLGGGLVLMSACCSGQRSVAGRGRAELPGDELFGLQAALFTAGARAIVGCMWPVRDSVAPEIMLAIHERLLGGDPPDIALQVAVTAFRRAAGPLTRQPYFWAPFFLSAVGRPQPFLVNGASP